MSEKKSVLILTGGHKHATSESINVGDVAQLEHLIHTINVHLTNCSYKIIAHSSNDRPALPDMSYSHHIIDFLHPKQKSKMMQYPIFALRSLTLIALALACNTNKRLRSKILSRVTTLKEITEQDAVIISGSGTLNDSYIQGTAFIWSLTVLIANILNIPTILIGQQIGPLNTAISRFIIGTAISRSKFIGVRDDESYKLALALGCEPERVQFTGDEGQYILPMTGHDSDQTLSPTEKGRYISVHFRTDKNCPFENSTERFSILIKSIANRLDAKILLVPFSYGNEKCDLTDCKEIANHLQNEVIIVDQFRSSSIHKHLISNSIAAIGVANHFCVFAASVNVPTLGIYGSTYMEQKLKGVEQAHEHVVTANINELKDSDRLTENFVHHCNRFLSLRQDLEIPAMHKPNDYLRWLSLIDKNYA